MHIQDYNQAYIVELRKLTSVILNSLLILCTCIGFEFTTNVGSFWNRDLLLLTTPVSMLDIAGSWAGVACK